MTKRKDGQHKNCNYKDLTGKKYNKLTVLYREWNEEKGQHTWVCQCDCGNIVKGLGSHALTSGGTKSCGCARIEENKSRTKEVKKPRKKDRLYSIWQDMKRRCDNPNRPRYENYGGKGIKVCKEWHDDFPTFKKWAEENGYASNLSIERIDINGNYCPENCKWIPMSEQAKNTSRTNIIEYDGKKQCLTDWAKELNVNRSTLQRRIKAGKPVEEVLKEYVQNK